MRAAAFAVLLSFSAFAQSERSLAISHGVPIAEGPAEDFLQFFYNLETLGQHDPSVEARALGFSEDQLRSIIDTTADLAAASRDFHEMWKPWRFEALMEIVDTGSMTPSTETKMRDFQRQWSEIILGHVRRIRDVIGPQRFRELDFFVRSRKPTSDLPVKKSPQ